MTVLMVIATFAVFIFLDYVLARQRGKVQEPELAAAPLPQAAPLQPEPFWVAGFQMHEGLHYHRGHTWARVEGDGSVTVGLDDFARRLLGPARQVRLPDVGAWIDQGERGAAVRVDGREAELIAPVEGEVLAVNSELATQPQLATDDPYGRGWLLRLRPAHLAGDLRNLLSGSLARRFMEDAREMLDLRLMALSGSVLHDGGEPAADFALHLPGDEWQRLVGELLLAPGHLHHAA